MVDPVEGFREVGCGNHSAVWGFSLVKTRGDLRGKWEEGGNGGPTMEEAVLEGGPWKRRAKKGKNKSLKDFKGGTKERNWAEGSAYIKGLVRLRDGEDEGMFPNRGKIRMGKGQVEKESEERNTLRTKVLKVKVGQTVRTQGSGALRSRDGTAHQFRCERRKRVIKLQFSDLAQNLTSEARLTAGEGGHILLIQASGNG